MDDSDTSNTVVTRSVHSDMIESATSVKKFFFQRGQDDKFTASEILQQPVQIKSGGNFKVSVTTGGFLPGWYCAVFGVSLAHLEDIEDRLDKIIFDVTSTEMNTRVIRMQDYTCETVIKKDEIAGLLTLPRPRTESTRLKLHRQIEVKSDSDFDLTISMRVETVPGCEENTSLALHYFELACPNTCSEDHALWGDGKPDQFIRIGAAGAALGLKPIVIEACDISASGKLAVTVYIDPTPTEGSDVTDTRHIAYIDVWNLSVPSGQASSGHPEEITESVASWTVSVPASRKSQGDSLENSVFEDPPQPPRSTINISSTGLHLIMAVGWEETAVHAAPFLIYRTEQNPPVQYIYNQVPGICQEIQESFGLGAFHNIDQDDPNSENERFFNYYDSQFDIYSTTGGWKRLHSLTFGIKGTLPTSPDMDYLTESLRGRYFAWTGDRGSVAIWNFETGKHVKTILIPKDKRGVCAALSEDGSMVAITVNGRIRVHHVDSGIELGVYKTKWKEDNGSEIIFRQDYFMALDVARSTSGPKNIDARSIFRVRDMKVVETHHVCWQYGAMFSSTLNPVFAYKQGAIVNIKRLGNILSPNEHNDCTPSTACAFDDVSLNLEGDKWTSQNPSSAGITFGLECDNSSLGAQSIQKLIITNGLNKVSLSLGPPQESHHCSGFYLAISSQLVLILNGFLQVWRVPFTDDQQYELVHVEAFVAVPNIHANDTCITKVSTVQSCTHGRKFIMKMKPIEWHSDPNKQETEDDPEDDEGEGGGQGTEEVKSGSAGEDATDGSREEQHPGYDLIERTLTFPRADDDTFPTTPEYRYEKGIVSLLDTYADSDESIKEAIIRFLVDHLRPSSKNRASSLEILCRAWKYNNRATFKTVLDKLLPEKGSVTWIPDKNAEKRGDPLSILLEIAKNCPVVLDPCKTVLNYCVSQAIAYKNISFLSPFLQNLKEIMTLFPDEAREYLRKIAYIPVSDRQRDDIVENSTVNYSPWHCIHSSTTPSRLDKIKKRVYQVDETTNGPRMKADTFHQHIYVATFNALWCFTDKADCKSNGKAVLKKNQPQVAQPRRGFMPWLMGRLVPKKIRTHKSTPEAAAIPEATPEATAMPPQEATTMPKPEATMVQMPEAPTVQMTATEAATSQDPPTHQESTIKQKTNWWKTAYHMLRLKCRLKTHTYVTCYDFSLETLDNPAITALVSYKWNTIGRPYWAFRFLSHCVFYALVFVAALLQVYYENVGRKQLEGIFFAIIVMGAVFLWLELLQAIKNFTRYRQDMYNLLDLVVYSLPMIASITLLKGLYEDDENTKTRIMSFSVLAVFFHMLSELRINKSVCKYEYIIRQSVLQIRVFFLIFAGGLVAFTIAFLHLLRACPVPGKCDVVSKAAFNSTFTRHFIGALSDTYFIMGGRYDTVTKELDSPDWAFHFMLAVYFFFTVIIMLNVLIALINKAFAKGDDDWRKDWILSRLHFIESAENLSYHIPGFRDTHKWFPDVIYFSATPKEVEEYSKEKLETQVQGLKSQLGELKKLLLNLDKSNKAETTNETNRP
ncbi:unnamed protein product [Mortierella alpina]